MNNKYPQAGHPYIPRCGTLISPRFDILPQVVHCFLFFGDLCLIHMTVQVQIPKSVSVLVAYDPGTSCKCAGACKCFEPMHNPGVLANFVCLKTIISVSTTKYNWLLTFLMYFLVLMTNALANPSTLFWYWIKCHCGCWIKQSWEIIKICQNF